ncbi:envelope stress response membrane protein PspC [Altererythrobacter sp. H2]|uniref:envelope stress response membrane protein PspC n=1 Tax=Altererythrobacter sp. H2 TaxID=3108391 RepID=UPI000BD5C763|nr:envelope stress response membrane protein PspC [Altererythrobacter sp. H2]OZA94814.1 MAG: envelope stress response membrane protein PspC [Erythrobacter sp. 34-65-8]WRK96678.1 envelope stress response membrane protein PspC [Altererythrobacter sp. H2]
MTSPRTTLYKDPFNRKIMGVCAGIADYTGVNALWVRLGAIALTVMGAAPLIIPGYFIAGLLLNKKPAHLYVDPEEQKYWQGVRQSPKRTAREIRSRMRDIDRRLADVETYYVSSNPRLNAEIERLR